MIVEFFQIITAIMAVYGAYCVILGISQMLLNNSGVKTAVAIFSDGKPTDSFNIPSNKIFGGISKTVVLVDNMTDKRKTEEIAKRYKNYDIFLIKKYDDDE